MKNLSLPRFTFLLGSTDLARYDLAKALVASTFNSVYVGDLDTPILNGITGMFYDCNVLKDLDAVPDEVLPGTASTTVRDMYHGLLKLLRQSLGATALGQLALVDHRSNLDLFDNFIYRDLNQMTDVLPFMNQDAGFNPKNVLIINLGELKSHNLVGPAYIWLPVPEVSTQILIIEKELIILRRTGVLNGS